jgi:hypothetical protein
MKLLIYLIIASAMVSQIDKNKFRNKTIINQASIAGNNIEALITNYGQLFWNGGSAGFRSPAPVFSNNDNQNPASTIFAAGLWIGGKIGGDVKASASIYSSSYIPGEITSIANDANLTPLFADKNLPKYKIYYYFSDQHIEFLNDLLLLADTTATGKVHQFANNQLALALNYKTEWLEAINQGAPSVPPGDVSAFMIYHDADISQHSNSSLRTKRLNVQIRQLNWLFRSDFDGINNAVFTQLEFINMNPVPIIEMYASIWHDADIGNANDDYVGSDYELGIGYTYNGNGNDNIYDLLGIAPPAVGIDFLEGPIVSDPSTNVIKRGSSFPIFFNQSENYVARSSDLILPNKKVLKASSIVYYNNTAAVDGNPSNSTHIYNYMQAKNQEANPFSVQTEAINNGLTSIEKSNYFFNGDPLLGSGWIETSAPDDKRLLINSGPFTLDVYNDINNNGKVDFGDAGYNKIVFATFNSFGSNHKTSVAKLKYDNLDIKSIYQSTYYKQPNLPEPILSSKSDYKEIRLDWTTSNISFNDPDGTSITQNTESYSADGYIFQGYQIVQFTDTNLKDYIDIKFIDKIDNIGIVSQNIVDNDGDVILKPVVKGTNSGITNKFIINKNYINNQSLDANALYNYGIRAYAVKPDAKNKKVIFSNWEKVSNLSINLNFDTIPIVSYGDLVTYNSNIQDNNALHIEVIDPYATTNAYYKITFDTLTVKKYHLGYSNTDSIPVGTLVWNLFKNTDLIIQDFPQFNPTIGETHFFNVYIDGLEIRVNQITNGFSDFLLTQNSAGLANYSAAVTFQNFPVSNNPVVGQQSTNQSMWLIHTNPGYSSYDQFITRVTKNNAIDPFKYDFEIRFTYKSNNFAKLYNDNYIINVPFELWETTQNIRIIPRVIMLDGDSTFNIQKSDHLVSSGNNDPHTELMYFNLPLDLTAGESGYLSWLSGTDYTLHGNEILARITLTNWDGGDVSDSTFPANLNATMPEQGSVFRIVSNKPSDINTEFTFQGPGLPVSSNFKDITIKLELNNQISNHNITSNIIYEHISSNLDTTFHKVKKISTNINKTDQYRLITDKNYFVDFIGRKDNENNSVTALDLALIQRHILALDTLVDPEKLLTADANFSGSITSADLAILKRYILGLDSAIISPDKKIINWVVIPDNYVFSNADSPYLELKSLTDKFKIKVNNDTILDFNSLRIGDVNNSFESKREKNSIEKFNIDLDLEIKKEHLMTLKILSSNKVNLTSLQYTISWDPDLLELEQFESDLENSSFSEKNKNIGELTFLWFSSLAQEIDTQELLNNVQFKRKGKGNSKIEISSERTSALASNSEFEEMLVTSEPIFTSGKEKIPKTFSLKQNYPNPFNPATTIEFNLPQKETVTIEIFNSLGQKVNVFKSNYPAGNHKFIWSSKNNFGKRVSSGIYFYRIQAGKFINTKKMVLLK